MTDLCVDHVLILVPDLDRARGAMQRLGFTVTPIAEHSAHLGTANATIVFRDRRTYLELIAVKTPTEHNAPMRRAVAARGSHVFGLALAGDARAAAEDLQARGVGISDPIDFSRKVDHPDGPREAAFTIALLEDGVVPGLYGLICQHHTPDAVWRRDALEHPNGVTRLRAVVGTGDDLDAEARAWGRIKPENVSVAEDRLEITTATANVVYRSREAWQEECSYAAPNDQPIINGIELGVPSIGDLESQIGEKGLNFWYDKEKERLMTDELCEGVLLVFSQSE